MTPKSNKLKPEVSAPALGGFTKLENQINWNQRFRLLVGSEGRSGVREWAETPAGFAAEGGKFGWSLCPRAHSATALGPNQEPNTSGFNFLIFEFREYHLRQEPNTLDFNFLILVPHEYHLRFSSFHVKIFVNTIQNFLTTQWNPGQKIKKICAVFIEIPHWWFFAKNTAVTFYNVQITNLVAIAWVPFNPHIYHPLNICLRRFNLILYLAILRCQNKKRNLNLLFNCELHELFLHAW